MRVIDWLLDSDPAIRWQALRDLADAPPGVAASERARVAHEGWGARLLSLQGDDGQWDGGACFPAASTGWRSEGRGQPSHQKAASGESLPPAEHGEYRAD